MLIFNELIFHISLEVMQEARSDELDLLIFPLHISHASQPLDVRMDLSVVEKKLTHDN